MLWSKRNSLLNWPDSTGNAPRNTKNKKEAPEKLEESSGGRNRTHRRDLEYKSETDRSRRVKLGRKARYQQAFKKAKQDKIDRKANVKQAKKRSTSGKRKARQQ